MGAVLLLCFFSHDFACAQENVVDEKAFINALDKSLANPEIQKNIPSRKQIVKKDPPGWLRAFFNGISDFLSALAPLLKIMFYLILAGIIAWFFYFLVNHVDWSRGKKDDKKKNIIKRTIVSSTQQKPQIKKKVTLADADELASGENYSAAVHILLIAAIDIIQTKLKGLLAISETSREIMKNKNIPDQDRSLISYIVVYVERALFAGQNLDKNDYEFCREKFLELSSGNDEVVI